jgi:hypothetical protein
MLPPRTRAHTGGAYWLVGADVEAPAGEPGGTAGRPLRGSRTPADVTSRPTLLLADRTVAAVSDALLMLS